MVAFRGTDSGEASDWLANVGRNAFNTPHGQIHSGFHAAYGAMQSQVDTALGQKRPKYLWVTGHSLGGALALVCTFELLETESTAFAGLMTFGQPMVARPNLAKYLDDKLLGKFVHFVNRDDIVPRLPPSHKHCGSLVWFTSDGIQRSKPKRVAAMAAPGAPAGDPDADDEGEIPPLSEREFAELQAKMRAKKAVEPELVDGTPAYAATANFIEDHAMELYLENIREAVGIGSAP